MGVNPSELIELADETWKIAGPVIISEYVKRQFAKKSASSDRSAKSSSAALDRAIGQVDSSRFGRQIAEAFRWAGEVHVQGMPTPVDTTGSTVPLEMSSIPRRFRQPGQLGEVVSEADLFRSDTSVLLLGDPGSGKTTALKRLVLGMFDHIPTPVDADLAFPVLVVCREINWTTTRLPVVIAERVGISLEPLVTQLELTGSDEVLFIADMVDRLKCLIIVDGLDEVAPGSRNALLDDLQRLERVLAGSRIVCSSRSGHAPHIEGVQSFELLPLTPAQRAEIVSRRLDDGVGFLERVEQTGIDEMLLDRPLFLNHLIRVFEATGSVADRPSDLYGQLVRLMIHDWDEQRRIHRKSSVRGLDATTMEILLRDIAYRLTQAHLQLFTEMELYTTVSDLAEMYNLDGRDVRTILRQIEAHSGFIVEDAAGFQFSHSTLQEYLTAQYIVLRPNHKSVERVLMQNPELTAVAVALSSNPTDWFLDRVSEKILRTSGDVSIFIDRLGQERPRFIRSNDLGMHLLKLMGRTEVKDAEVWRRLRAVDAVSDSINRSLASYHLTPKGERVELAKTRDRQSADERRVARYVVPRTALSLFVASEG